MSNWKDYALLALGMVLIAVCILIPTSLYWSYHEQLRKDGTILIWQQPRYEFHQAGSSGANP